MTHKQRTAQHSRAQQSPTGGQPAGPGGAGARGQETGARQQGPVGARGCSGPVGAAASPCFSAGPPGASTSEATPRPLGLPGLDPSPLGSHPTHPAQEANMAEAFLLHPLCPFPTCQPAARTVPTGVTPCLGAYTTSGSTGATVWPPQAHESPFLPPDHACTPRACAGGRRGPGERPDQQSPQQGGGQAPGRSGYCGLREGARRVLLPPVPASPGTCPLPQVLCPHPVGPTGPPHHQLRPLPSGCGGAGTGRAMQPEGRIQGLRRGCRQKASEVAEHGPGQLDGPEALGQ